MSDDRLQQIEQIIDGMGLRALYGNQSDRDLRRVISGFSDNTIQVIQENLHREQGEQQKTMYSLLMTSSEDTIREYLRLVPHGMENVSTGQLLAMINGLYFLAHFRGCRRLEELTGRDLQVAQAFLTVTAALYEASGETVLNYHGSEDGNDDALYVFAEAFHDLIVANSDRASDIAECISERQTGDTEAIREYLANETVLRDDAL